MRWIQIGLLAVIAVATGGGALADFFSDSPQITAQGFSSDTALRGEAGRFSSARMRVEAPSRIAKLLITRDGEEIDLANTADRSQFALFGLDQRPMNAFDVTLEFAAYINKHLTKPATYRIGMTVVDRRGGVAHTTLTVTVVGEDEATSDSKMDARASQRLQESALTLRRQGSGPVEPVAATPLTWVTRDAVHVTIRLRPAKPRSELRQIRPSSWDNIVTREGLEQRLAETPSLPYIDVPTARNGGAGTVVAISGGDGDALIRLTSSSTSVSPLGTTVTLTASVRD